MVTRSMLDDYIARHPGCSLDDLRRGTRLGMGPCQGGFCTFRAAGVVGELAGRAGAVDAADVADRAILGFLRERFKGTLPIAAGRQLQEQWMVNGIYEGGLGVESLLESAPLAAPRRSPVPSADVVIVGAGLAGLTAALAAAESGARVHVLAKGHAATHWGPGGIDVAGIPTAATPREGIQLLAGRPGHPYAFLGGDVPTALDWVRGHLAAEGLDYVGDLDTPHQLAPTSIGGTRRAAILPAGQAAALGPWAEGERLVVCGIAGFKDFWPEAIATSLSRERIWAGGTGPRR